MTRRQKFLLFVFAGMFAAVGASLVAPKNGDRAFAGNATASVPLIKQQFLDRFEKADVYAQPQAPVQTLLYDSHDKAFTAWNELTAKSGLTLVNLWATWCGSCLVEIPSLLELQRHYADKGLKIIFVSLDFVKDATALQQRMSMSGMPTIESYYIKDVEMWESLNLIGIPTTLILNAQGQILYKLAGDTDWGNADSFAFFDNIIAENR